MRVSFHTFIDVENRAETICEIFHMAKGDKGILGYPCVSQNEE